MSIVKIYVNDFFFISNIINTMQTLKKRIKKRVENK